MNFGASQDKPVLRSRMVGPFRLETTGGEDLTPKGAKHVGLLALLLMAPRHERSREYLMDKLWSDRQQTQANNSLKGALSDLRKILSAHSDVLVTEGAMVGLRPGAIERDLDNPRNLNFDEQEFLEGISIRDPEFTDWLRDQRIALEQSLDRPVRPVIAIRNRGEGSEIHNSIMSSWVSTGLADWSAMEISAEYRTSETGKSAKQEPSRLILDTFAARGESAVALRMRLLHERTGTEMWSQVESIEADPGRLIEDEAAHKIINYVVDRTLFQLDGSDVTSPEARYLEQGAVGAVRLIFRNEGDDLEAAQALLAQNHEANPSGIYLAWSAYLMSFLKAEHNRPIQDLKDETEELTRKAMELDPNSSMTLALCSYAFTYLIGKPELGLQLAAKSTRANRSNPMAWCLKAASHYTLGQYEAAFQSASRARAIAGDGPYRYAVETYYCISAMLANRVTEAIEAGEVASLLKPGFKAPLRCLAILYASRNDEARLQEVVGRLRRVEPEFSMRQLIEDGNYPSQLIRKANVAHMLDI